MDLNRRGFFKILGGASGAILASQIKPSQAATALDPPSEAYGCLVDTTLCVGCRKCEQACNERHHLPKPKESFEEMTVLENERRMDETSYTVVNKYYPKHIGTLTWRTRP
ncbi:MAG: hypothetical protein PVJ18_06620, partial [Desulfobacterales bacterium]